MFILFLSLLNKSFFNTLIDLSLLIFAIKVKLINPDLGTNYSFALDTHLDSFSFISK